MPPLSFALAILALSVVLQNYWTASTQSWCRCRPGDRCWPSASDWRQLNHSITGNLQSLRPAGHVCYGDDYSKVACEDYITNFHNGTWRVLNPASVQVVNWEAWRDKEESCHVGVDEPRPIINRTCGQGRVPVYSAHVQTVDQVREVVKFAASHRLRLSVRNTGHDLAGRSTAPGSLMVHTAGLRGIHYSNAFHPSVPLSGEVSDIGPAVTIGAGVMTGELYESAAALGYTVVGGSCKTVGIAGGWMQSGGYGILSPSKGLGVDNVVEFGLVTATGAYVTANEHQNQDLFHAVRGGGSGTFGIITSVTFRVYPDVSLEVRKLGAMVETDPDDALWHGLEQVLAAGPQWVDLGIASQTYVFPISPAGAGSLISVELFSVNQSHASAASIADSLEHSWSKIGLQAQRSEEHFAHISSYHASRNSDDMAGVGVMVGSRLISRDMLTHLDGPARLSHALAQLEYKPGDIISVDGMAPGKSARQSQIPNSMHPAWKSTVMTLNLGRGLPLDPNWEAYRQVEDELKHTQLPAIDSLENGTMGGYLGIPFPYEADHRRIFWGDKYHGLLEAKRRWDPNDLFITRSGVGSEMWDDEGMCRTGWTTEGMRTALEEDMRWLRRQYNRWQSVNLW